MVIQLVVEVLHVRNAGSTKPMRRQAMTRIDVAMIMQDDYDEMAARLIQMEIRRR